MSIKIENWPQIFLSQWDNEKSMMISITMIIMKLLILSILRSVCWSEVNKWSLQVEFKYLILVVWETSLRTVVFVERRCDLKSIVWIRCGWIWFKFVLKIRTKLVDIIASCAWPFNVNLIIISISLLSSETKKIYIRKYFYIQTLGTASFWLFQLEVRRNIHL